MDHSLISDDYFLTLRRRSTWPFQAASDRECASSSIDRQSAISTLSALVGAIILSRAVRRGRPELSDEILQTVNTVQAAARRRGPQPNVVKKRGKRQA